MLEDATVEGGLSYITSYTINPNPAHRPYCVFAISFSLKHVKAIILANVATPTSVTAIYAHYRYVVDNTREYLLFGGKFGFAEFNAEALALHGGDYYYATWRGGRTPDPVLNAVFRKAEFMFLNTTSSGAFEVTHGGNDYVASAARIYDPDTRLDWLLTEYTPREEFYAASDTARLTGILIGVAGALVVLATCIFIWAIIRFPLRFMHTSMDLAADMRNDEVVHIDPLLSEVQDLSEAFRQMNSKLLAARSFLPQSLLRAINNAEEENLSEGDARRQDDDELMSTPSVAVASNRLEEGSAARGDTVASQKSNQMVRKRLNGFDRDMSHRRVGILSINVIAFHTALTTTADHHQQVGSCSSGLSAIMSAHSTLADIIEQVTKEERGIVDYFHGDRFVCGFNTARACGSPARNAAETSNKIWERFLSNKILSQTFPSGLSMGLSVGKAAVGNHGTETMQRLATIGAVYTEAMRLQEVMSRRLLNNNSRTENVSSSILAGRCLTTAHVFSDLETSNIPFQILGGIHPHLLQTASHNDKISLKEETGMKRPFGHNDNTSLRKETRAKPNFEISLREEGTKKSYGYGSLLVAAIASSERNNVTVEEWLYHFNKDDMSARNPYATVNAALQRMWRFKNDRDEKLAVDPDKAALIELAMSFRMPSDKAINYSDSVMHWLEYVTNILTTAATADEVRNKLSYATT